MDMKYDLKQLIEELDTVHEDGFFSRNQLGEHEVFLNFNTARNGFQRHFSKAALKAISSLTRQLHESDVAISSVIEVKGLETHVRQCIANLHAEEVIDPTQMDGPDGAYEKFLKEVHESLSQLHTVFTHFFPAWTLGMEHDRPFVIGPVTVMTRDQWLDSVVAELRVPDREPAAVSAPVSPP